MQTYMKKYWILSMVGILFLTILMIVLATHQTKTKANSDFFDVDISHWDVNNSCSNISKQDDEFFTINNLGGIPQIYDGAKEFGIFCSEPIKSKQEFQGAIINLETKEIGNKDRLIIEARGSKDGSNWSEWFQTNENNTNAEFKFYDAFQYVQFRITIVISTENSKPQFKIVSLKLKKVSEDEKKLFEQKVYTDKPLDNKLQVTPISVAPTEEPSQSLIDEATQINGAKYAYYDWVKSTYPKNGSNNVSPSTNIKIEFSQDMNPDTLNEKTIQIYDGKHSHNISAIYNYKYNTKTRVLNIAFKIPGNDIGSGNGLDIYLKKDIMNAKNEELGVDLHFGFCTQ